MDHNSDLFYFTCTILIYYYSALFVLCSANLSKNIVSSRVIPSICTRSGIRWKIMAMSLLRYSRTTMLCNRLIADEIFVPRFNEAA